MLSLADTANVVTVIGLPLAVWGLFAVGRQMKNDRLAVSAGAIGDLRLSIMDRVNKLAAINIAGDVDAWNDEFLEFANDLEMACAIYLDGQMSGRTGELARTLISDFLQMINEDEDMRVAMASAIHSATTFKNIVEFRAQVDKHAANK